MSTEAEQRAAVVAAARSWVGTPYHNMADVKGVGVDCGMLLVRVFVDCGLTPAFDPRPYAFDAHLHRSDEGYLGKVLARAGEVTAPAPGDAMLFHFGRCYSHGGIVTAADPLTIVHAFYQTRCVVEDIVAHNALMASPDRKPRFFSYWAPRAA
jgi:cell wall-associated NlpC family hydrolase